MKVVLQLYYTCNVLLLKIDLQKSNKPKFLHRVGEVYYGNYCQLKQKLNLMDVDIK